MSIENQAFCFCIMVLNVLFAVADVIFQLTSAINLGLGEEMCKMTGHLLYLCKLYKQVILIAALKGAV